MMKQATTGFNCLETFIGNRSENLPSTVKTPSVASLRGFCCDKFVVKVNHLR